MEEVPRFSSLASGNCTESRRDAVRYPAERGKATPAGVQRLAGTRTGVSQDDDAGTCAGDPGRLPQRRLAALSVIDLADAGAVDDRGLDQDAAGCGSERTRRGDPGPAPALGMCRRCALGWRCAVRLRAAEAADVSRDAVLLARSPGLPGVCGGSGRMGADRRLAGGCLRSGGRGRRGGREETYPCSCSRTT